MGDQMTEVEAQRLVHELQVHQHELEMQNEELRNTRAELEAMLDKYTDLYDFAPVGYFTLGRDGTIHAVNLTGACLLGIERSRLVGRRLGLSVSDESRKVFHDFLDLVFSGGNKEACEVGLLNGLRTPLFARIEAIASVSGAECRAAVIDITEQKLTESELQQTVESLGNEIAERKKIEKQLLQAQKMESIGLLAGGVAHEFNNMLTAIIGYGEDIRDRLPGDDEHLRGCIEQVLRGAGRAAELTGSLLAFSRKQENDPKPVQIDTVIANTIKLIRKVIGEDIELSFVLPCKKLIVMADSAQMEHVLLNLATNARDAMPDGGRLSISVRNVTVTEGAEKSYDLPAHGNYALISVADTGMGIEKELLSRLFEPFYTTKEVGKGTGLGLSIVYGIVKQHNGSVLVNSEPGKGTTFDIYLPLFYGPLAGEEDETSLPVAGGTETLLVVEDEEMVRVLMKQILEKAGYTVIVACDGQDAIAKFRERDDISLVLSDVVMPKKITGDILDDMRRFKPGIKVVFISGYSSDIMLKKGLKEEGTELITKPVKKYELLRKIREILDRG